MIPDPKKKMMDSVRDDNNSLSSITPHQLRSLSEQRLKIRRLK